MWRIVVKEEATNEGLMFHMYGLRIGCNPEILDSVMSYDDDAAVARPPSSSPPPLSPPKLYYLYNK
jgi:hypothetical protein